MNAYQRDLLAKIEGIKRDLRTATGEQRKQLHAQAKKLAHWLTEDDDREPELHRRKQDPGGGSRSPSFGRWANDDERQLS